MFVTALSVLCASMAALGLGLDVGMISSTLVQPSFIFYFKEPTSGEIGGIVSAFSAGATFGAFGCAFVADRYGRVVGLTSGAIIAVIGIVLQAAAVNVPMLIIGRLINGAGAGQLTAVFPVYASEIAPPKIRGMLGGFQMLMIEAGIFAATGSGYGFGTHFTNNWQWRGPLAVQAIPLVFLIPLTFALPETPRFLISKSKMVKAERVLRRLHLSSGGESFVQSELEEIKAQLAAERQAYRPNWKQVITKKSWRKRLILTIGLQSFAQLTGINCIQYYASSIYKSLGFTTERALALNLIYGAFGLVFAFVWVFTLDRFPRIRVLIVSTFMMGSALLVQSVLSAVYANKVSVNHNALNAQVAMFFVFNLFFVAVGMLAWLIPPEMSPMIIRGKINSVSVSANNIMGLAVAQMSPTALEKLGFKFFYLFVACNLVAVVTYWRFYPETSKLTLEEIDTLFGDEIIDHGQHVGAVEHLPEATEIEDHDFKPEAIHHEYKA